MQSFLYSKNLNVRNERLLQAGAGLVRLSLKVTLMRYFYRTKPGPEVYIRLNGQFSIPHVITPD